MDSLLVSEIIISGTIVFVPANRELRNDLTGKRAILHTPANYCLLYLLSNSPQILTKTELIKLAWHNQTQVVTDNTFYQMVFHLRQSLATVGGKNVIVTVPRQGLKINSDISVKIIEAVIHEKTQTTYRTLHSVIISFVSKNGERNIFLFFLFAALLCISAFLYTAEPDKVAFDGYRYQEYNMCAISYNEGIYKENISALLMESKNDCLQKRHIILSRSDNHSRLSVISCPATANMEFCTLSLYVQRDFHAQ